MTCLRSIFRALMLVGFSCYSSFALGPTDEASCCLHPDPHIISFHGIGYDYQHGCDNILVDNPNIKIHARFVKYLWTMGTGFSYIEGIGIEEVSTGQKIEIRPNFYYINDPGLTSPNPVSGGAVATTIGTLPFSISTITMGGSTGYEYTIEFPFVGGVTHNIVIEDWGSLLGGGGGAPAGQKGYGISACINAHGSYFLDSVGMCGQWSAAGGLNDRGGADMIPAYAAFGDEWQVGGTDGPFMSSGPSQVFPPSGHAFHPASCQARRMLADEDIEGRNDENHRELQADEECEFCSTLPKELERKNCQFDASVIGCANAKKWGQPYYGADSKYYKNVPDDPVIIKPKKCKKLFGDGWKRTKCEKKRGKCVRFCDTKDENIECVLGWCDQKTPYEFPKGKDVLKNGQYYNGCACMLKKKPRDEIDEDKNDGRDEDPE